MDVARAYVPYILEHQQNVDLKNGMGSTALHWAVVSGHLDIVKALVQKGADPEV